MQGINSLRRTCRKWNSVYNELNDPLIMISSLRYFHARFSFRSLPSQKGLGPWLPQSWLYSLLNHVYIFNYRTRGMQGIVGRAWASKVWADIVAYTGLGVHGNLVNMRCMYIFLPHYHSSLGTRPSKNWKGGSGTSAGVEVYTVPGMKAHFWLAFD